MTTIYVVTWCYSVGEIGKPLGGGIVGARWKEQEASDLAALLTEHSGTRAFGVQAVVLDGARPLPAEQQQDIDIWKQKQRIHPEIKFGAAIGTCAPEPAKREGYIGDRYGGTA